MDGVFKHYVIDLSCNNNFVQVPAVQGDGNNVRGFEVELISNNVQYVVDAEKVIVSIAGTKPDTKEVLNECEVTEEGFILVDITSQMTAVAGRGDYSITLMDRETNSLLQSFPFYILITKSAFNANEIVSSNEYQLLTHTVVDAKNTIDDIRELETEITANEDVRKQAEMSREQTEQLRKDAETLREQAEIVREQAEADREQAEISREQAEQQRQTDTATAIQNTNDAIANANKATNDTLDAIQDAVDATNDAIVATKDANDTTSRVNALESSFTNAENIRVQNENTRIQNELKRKSDNATALNELNNATADTISATDKANAISTDLENKLASGYFNGKDGKDGVITTVEMNQMAFNVVDGNLILTYENGNTDATKFSIDSEGNLIYSL